MTKQQFRDFCANRFIILDGATGSNLIKRGMPSGVCPEQWILEHPQALVELQRDYVAAGTNILYAPTFTANRIKLEEYGLADRQEEMIYSLVALSRQAAGRSAAGGQSGEGQTAGDNITFIAADKAAGTAEDRERVLVAGDLTMTGQQLRPMGTMELETLIEVYKEQIRVMESAGVDLLVVETMMSLGETRAALIAARETTELPVMVTMTFEADGRTLFGTDAETAAIVLESLGADAIGVNCSTGPAKMKGIVEAMARVSSLPLIAKPNAGLPAVNEQGQTVYDMDSDTFTAEMEELADAGAVILGGCCGTDPCYIAGLKRMTQGKKPRERKRRPDGIRYLTGERKTLAFGLEDPFMIIGERINPTGKKKLQEQLRNGNMDLVLQYAQEQDACGASVLDINMGMSGIDEKAMMLRVLEEVQGITDLPLSLDSSHVEVLEAALRHYPGRALVNSVSYETEKFEKLLPIVQKYGAMFILLPLSDKGLPENLEEKKQIIDCIVTRAQELGMRREDIIVDGLVTTIGANKLAALETLETIRYCKAQGLATVCGLSNISFGMPARPYVNTAFLTLAIYEGLTMAIANPSQEMLVCGALATDMLKVRKDADLRYIEYAAQLQPVTAAAGPGNSGAAAGIGRSDPQAVSGAGQGNPGTMLGAGQGNPGTMSSAGQGNPGTASGAGQGNSGAAAGIDRSDPQAASGFGQNGGAARAPQTYAQKITDAVLKGNRSGIAAMTREAVAAGEDPGTLLNDSLLPAINKVGDLFEKKKYFLPQLIASAEAMKNAIEVLEPYLLKKQDGDSMPVVVIATVEGDIHDIGKNLVALMLKNYGFKVIDLGKDVPKETIVQAAKEHHADIIALSALMTTTMQRMREVVALARQEGVTARIMVGGAVITQEYADEIHADGYSKDAAEAVKLARRLLGMMSADM